jgi:hypothetical protein
LTAFCRRWHGIAIVHATRRCPCSQASVAAWIKGLKDFRAVTRPQAGGDESGVAIAASVGGDGLVHYANGGYSDYDGYTYGGDEEDLDSADASDNDAVFSGHLKQRKTPP